MLWDNSDPSGGVGGSGRSCRPSGLPWRGFMRRSLLVLGLVAGASVGLAHAQGRGFGPSKSPSALRAIPAETTAAKTKDPNWKAPRTAWGHPDLEGTWSSDDMRGIPV